MNYFTSFWGTTNVTEKSVEELVDEFAEFDDSAEEQTNLSIDDFEVIEQDIRINELNKQLREWKDELLKKGLPEDDNIVVHKQYERSIISTGSTDAQYNQFTINDFNETITSIKIMELVETLYKTGFVRELGQ